MNEKDASKQSRSSPTGTTETTKTTEGGHLNLDGGKDRKDKSMKKDTNKKSNSSQTKGVTSYTAETWLEVDILGLRRTLERKGKAWAIFELVQNSWDTDATRVDVTLTKPNKNGMSTLTCRDNAPDGYRDLSEAHTLFGSSSKKADPTKRGRFNAGEKFVLVMCESAKVTSTTGQIVFLANGKRKETDVCTQAGTVFEGVLEMTVEEWLEVGRQVQLLLPPIPTTYNGVKVRQRNPRNVFEETLPTEVANDRGVLTQRKRKAEVRVYDVQLGEMPTIYERGIPVVEIDNKYHVSVEQKIPLNTERDNVTPGYLKTLNTVVLNAMKDYIKGEEATAAWVTMALGNTDKVTPEAAAAVLRERYGDKPALQDNRDIGSIKEATAQGFNVVPARAFTKQERETLKKHNLLKPTSHYCPTEKPLTEPKKTLNPSEYDADQKRYIQLIKEVSPLLIGRTAEVKIIDDEALKIRGCTRWEAQGIPSDMFVFEINLAFHDCSDWHGNYYLLLHELAHHKVQRNDHLHEDFYQTVNILGAKLAQLTLDLPELFPDVRLAIAA
jgi:hypothetical protein